MAGRHFFTVQNCRGFLAVESLGIIRYNKKKRMEEDI